MLQRQLKYLSEGVTADVTNTNSDRENERESESDDRCFLVNTVTKDLISMLTGCVTTERGFSLSSKPHTVSESGSHSWTSNSPA